MMSLIEWVPAGWATAGPAGHQAIRNIINIYNHTEFTTRTVATTSSRIITGNG